GLRKKPAKSRNLLSVESKASQAWSRPLKKSARAPAAMIKRKIEELRELERHAFRPRHGKKDFWEYLNGIYNAWDWTDATASARVGRRVATLCKVKTRAGNTPIRIVIDATSKQGRQDKSRWTQALEFTVAKGARRTAFKKFLDKNRGVFGC